MFNRRVSSFAVSALFAAAPAIASPVVASSLSGYSPGSAPASYQNPSAALGQLNGDTGDGLGALNPFNPAFQPSNIVIIGSGGSLTLQLSQNVQTTGQTLGVYSNVGYAGAGTTDSGPSTLGQISQAVVSVSQNGDNWVTLNGGNPIVFPIATNYYTDVPFANPQPLGNAPASQSKPYLGTVGQLTNSSYAQIVSQFNGSAGGTWLDLSATGLPGVNYVRFNVPAGQRMVIDAVGGLGAVNTLAAGSPIISESVGSGPETSNVVVDFNNGHSYDFQVHYSGTISGEAALSMIESNSDLRYTIQKYSFGDELTSLDYGGYVQDQPADFSNYWEYFNSTDGKNWNSYDVGFSDSVLTNGSWDGWLWSGGPEIAPSSPVAVPEPSAGLVLILVSAAAAMRRRAAGCAE